MSKLRNPNEKLRHQRELRGWSQRKVAAEVGTTEKRVSAWERGESAPSASYQEKLCLLFGKNTLELGLKRNLASTNIPPLLEESDGCFSFGKLKTTQIILDGDGTGVYLPQHIRTHYIPVAKELPEEFQAHKERIQREQEEKKASGDPYQWNGERYNLTKFNISRDATHEDMTLDLWFSPSDYYTFLATSMSLQEPEIRERYLADVEWNEAIPLFSHSFGTYLSVLTSDGYTILVQRGKGMGCRPNTFDISLAEGLSRPLDRSTTSQAPDLYRCACRGLSEELGLHEPVDFSSSDILFLSFAVETQYCMWGLFGVVKLQKRANEVLGNMQKGVRDKFENRKLFPVPFTPQDICSFVFSHEPFAPGGLVCLYHALVHEFGREDVDKIISSQ